MILFPNAKINLGLNVVEKRADGFHELETVFASICWSDILEIVQSGSKGVQFSSSGLKIEGDLEKNIVVKAFRLLEKDFDLPGVKIHLHKIIPMGAGLGGGSSDAAFALRALNELFNLELSIEKLKSYALQLGSDCAFFLENKPVFAKGRGEIFEPVQLDLNAYKILVLWPDIHSSTADAFSGIVPKKPTASIKEILKKNVSLWKNELKNDFEETIFRKFPEIKTVKEKLYEKGAVFASLSGSGSAVFGLFENAVPEIDWPSNYLAYKE